MPSSYFSAENAAYIDEMRVRYQSDPASVGESWRHFFSSETDFVPSHQALREEIVSRTQNGAARAVDGFAGGASAVKQHAVDALIAGYRLSGVREAAINPLDYDRPASGLLNPVTYGLSEADMDTVFVTDIPGLASSSLRDIVSRLRTAYCGSTVAEFLHIQNIEQRHWLQERFESPIPPPSPERQRHLLNRLVAAESLEKYLHTRYVGQKRFSLEGGDSLIPLLDSLLAEAGAGGVRETVIGMAHRGRLNVLVNILGKSPSALFMEFEGKRQRSDGSGDVKYHMGFSSALKTAHGQMHLALAFNPSHLEIVSPVVEGSVRARQDRRQDGSRKQVLAIQIHGDAAFAGQGVVMETLNFSQSRGYKTGGSIHVIVNNQIGFTTSTPDDARSTFFCTDVAKMVECPIIHVNCDDLVGVDFATRTAFEFRQRFGNSVIIDLVCFRRLGHNEQDEPLMTQPLMYQKIARHPGSLSLYAERLKKEGVVNDGQIAEMKADYRRCLEDGQSANLNAAPTQKSEFVDWNSYSPGDKNWDFAPKKPVPMKVLKALGRTLSTIPDDFAPHSQLKRLVAARREMVEGKRPVDWGMAENLSYASLLYEGYRVRLSGQDCGRGTFSHRHAVWHDQKRDKREGGNYVPLRHLSDKQGDFLVIDSILSEEGVLAFEYGYATTQPNALVIWEAQFGDFANGAQVVIDQFITSGEAKWQRFCGLVLLLPHGFEGQGPEHSSARLERYLQMCAEYNIQVCVPSSPAQIYHLLRRQMLRHIRRPLIVISPKSLLRHPEVTSSLEDLSKGRFAPVMGETDEDIKPAKVKRLVFCSGKIYYEVRAARRARKQTNVAICRLEQIYPFPHDYVKAEIARYKNADQVVWCQEEPGNQGAWHRICHYFNRHLGDKRHLTYALRRSAASPAVGFSDAHKAQQEEVIEAALDINSVV